MGFDEDDTALSQVARIGRSGGKGVLAGHAAGVASRLSADVGSSPQVPFPSAARTTRPGFSPRPECMSLISPASLPPPMSARLLLVPGQDTAAAEANCKQPHRPGARLLMTAMGVDTPVPAR